jgi:aldehyde dehydrogenase (NAD(P)+)
MFTILPTPPWFITAKTAAQLGKQLTHFEAHASPIQLPGIFFNALRG